MKQNDVNYVETVGRVKSVFFPKEKRCLIRLQVGYNMPEFFCVDDNAEYVKNNIQSGDFLRIISNIQSSYIKKLHKNVSTLFVNRIIKLSDTYCFERLKNEFYVRGEVKNAKYLDQSKILRVLVKTETFGHVSTVPLSFYNPSSELLNLKAGDIVQKSGMIQTMRKVVDGKLVYYQNFVVKEPLRKQKIVSAIGHRDGVWYIDDVSDCINGGSKHQVCSVCGQTIRTEMIPANGHQYTSVVTPPTCIDDGYTIYTCSVCGNSYMDSIVKAIDHTNKTTTTKATTAKDGKIVTACTICGKISKTVVIPKVASISLSATSYTYDGKVKTPTVTVKDSKKNTLKYNTDYTVTYASGRKMPGQYAVKITFKGNYSGSKTLYFTILPGVTSKIATATNSSAIKIAWKAVPGATGYQIFQYDAKTKKYVTLKTTTGTSYTVTKLKSGTNYKFAVKAYSTVNGKVYWASGYKTVTATTNPGTPTLKVTAGSKKAALSWTKQTGATGYVIYMATSQNGKYSRIATLKGNSKVSYTKTGLTKGKTYYFKVAAYTVANGKTLYSGYSSVKAVKIK